MKTIVCFGDSNTHGYNAENSGRFSEEIRWPGRLQEILGKEYSVKEEGLSGRTCVFDDPLFEGLNGHAAMGMVLLTHEPVDTLIVMLGTNDTKVRFGCTAGNITRGLEKLLLKAINTSDAWKDGKPDILVICPPPIEPGYIESSCAGEMGEGCDEKSRDLAPLYEEVARRLGCRFLDAGNIPGVEMNNIDYMHLTADAHGKLAEAVSKSLLDNE